MSDTFTTTADDVLADLDLTGRQIAITGATSGLGLAAARAFARAGADIALIGRDDAKLATARDVADGEGSGMITVEQVDLADLDAVAELSQKLAANLARLDVLVLNAGIMAAPLARSPQGHEMQLAVSHLGHHLLSTSLMDLLRRSRARVVALSSSGHWLSPFDFDDPDFTVREYDKWAAYGQAKTATALFAVEMANRFGNDGVVTVAVHPGVIKTELQRHLSAAEEEHVLAMSAERGEVRSVDAGAASIVWAAAAPEPTDHNGAYIASCAIANEQRAPHASTAGDAARLWSVTEALIAANR